MRILIVEDEQVAARSLERLLLACEPAAEIVAVLPTVRKAVAFLKDAPALDLIFLDIHLADGAVFSLFEEVVPQAPVIFTTAYDAYAVKAFELNSLDYLLKPIRQERLQQSLDRFKQRQQLADVPIVQKLDKVLQQLQHQPGEYKSRFLVKAGTRLLPLEVKEVAYFYRDTELVQLVAKEGRHYLVNYTLDELEGLLDPKHFFRLNRQLIASIGALSEIHPYFKGKLKIQLQPPASVEVIISQERAPLFKKWLEGQ